MIPDLFSRIQFGCIGGQPFDGESMRIPFVPYRHRGAMDTPPIQNEHDLASYHTPQRTDKGYHILPVDIMLIPSEINAQPLAPRRQGNGGLTNRPAIVAIPPLVYGRVTRQSPRPTTGGLQQEAALIHQGDGRPLVPGFFLIRGHSTKRHWRMASSSRSRARCWGYWHEKPNPCSRRPT